MKTITTTLALVAGILLSGAAMAGGGTTANATVESVQASGVNEGNHQGVTIEGSEATKIPRQAPSIAAPALTTTLSETCMGSTSFGASGPGFGLTFGSTWKDEACVRRLDARELRSFGAGLEYNSAILFHLAAKERMCEDDQIRAAFARVNKMTGNADALCQQTADEYKASDANRQANAAAGIVTPVQVSTLDESDMTQADRNMQAWDRPANRGDN